jgi:hypothetical protein
MTAPMTDGTEQLSLKMNGTESITLYRVVSLCVTHCVTHVPHNAIKLSLEVNAPSRPRFAASSRSS